MLAQSAPEPQLPVIAGHGNEPNTLGLVVKQVAERYHESLVVEATLGHDSAIQVRVDVEGLALPDGCCHLLHRLSHAAKDIDLLLHQASSIPLPIMDGVKWLVEGLHEGLVRAINDLDVWGPKELWHGRTKRLPRAHGMLPSCQLEGEDVLHLVVVLDGCVEELSVPWVVLTMKHKCC